MISFFHLFPTSSQTLLHIVWTHDVKQSGLPRVITWKSVSSTLATTRFALRNFSGGSWLRNKTKPFSWSSTKTKDMRSILQTSLNAHSKFSKVQHADGRKNTENERVHFLDKPNTRCLYTHPTHTTRYTKQVKYLRTLSKYIHGQIVFRFYRKTSESRYYNVFEFVFWAYPEIFEHAFGAGVSFLSPICWVRGEKTCIRTPACLTHVYNEETFALQPLHKTKNPPTVTTRRVSRRFHLFHTYNRCLLFVRVLVGS